MTSPLWTPPTEAPILPWARIEESLRIPHRSANPHFLGPHLAETPRRAAVAVVLWGDASGARKVVLVQRGYEAPQHAGEIAFPGGMEEPDDRDLPATARRELFEELGLGDALWELACFPDGVAKMRTRFTPVFFRWEAPEPHFRVGSEIREVFLLPLVPLMVAPWTLQTFELHGTTVTVPRLELPGAPLWGATALVLKTWLDILSQT